MAKKKINKKTKKLKFFKILYNFIFGEKMADTPKAEVVFMICSSDPSCDQAWWSPEAYDLMKSAGKLNDFGEVSDDGCLLETTQKMMALHNIFVDLKIFVEFLYV